MRPCLKRKEGKRRGRQESPVCKRPSQYARCFLFLFEDLRPLRPSAHPTGDGLCCCRGGMFGINLCLFKKIGGKCVGLQLKEGSWGPEIWFYLPSNSEKEQWGWEVRGGGGGRFRAVASRNFSNPIRQIANQLIRYKEVQGRNQPPDRKHILSQNTLNYIGHWDTYCLLTGSGKNDMKFNS